MEQTVFSNDEFNNFLNEKGSYGLGGYGSEAGYSADGSEVGTSTPRDERAPLSMRPKRVGRKLDTREPENKRRAQNRAAQRAFRERKERHLQELESRIAELEQESATWRNSSLVLRSKVTALEQELLDYRPPGKQNLVSGFGSDTASVKSSPSSQIQSHPKHPTPPQMPISLTPQSQQGSVDDLFYDGGGNGTTPGANASNGPATGFGTGSTLNNRANESTPAQSALGENPTSREFCDELSLACVVPQQMYGAGQGSKRPSNHMSSNSSMSGVSENNVNGLTPPTTVSSNSSTAGQQRGQQRGYQPSMQELIPNLGNDIMLGNTESPQVLTQPVKPEHTQSPAVASDASSATPARSGDPLNFSFPTSGDDQPFDVFQFVNNENTIYDAFDLDAVWDASPMTNQTAQPQQSLPQTQPLVPPAPSEEDKKLQKVVPAASEKYISCTEVWDRICSRPRFGEIDIQGMCCELRTKAKCSDSGVVLPERELEVLLEPYK